VVGTKLASATVAVDLQKHLYMKILLLCDVSPSPQANVAKDRNVSRVTGSHFVCLLG